MRTYIPDRYYERKPFHTKLGNGHIAPAKYRGGMHGHKKTNRLKTLREQRGLSQAELAQRIGVRQPSINRYERNNRRLSADRIYQLAAALDVHPGEILQELPATGLDSREERAAIEIARRLRGDDLQQWLTLGVSLSRDRKIIGKIR